MEQFMLFRIRGSKIPRISTQLSLELKEATRSVHQSLEVVVVRMLKSIRTPDHYAQLLSAFYGFHFPVEYQLDAWLNDSLIHYYSRRRRSSAILEDLRELGYKDIRPLGHEYSFLH